MKCMKGEKKDHCGGMQEIEMETVIAELLCLFKKKTPILVHAVLMP